MSTHRELFTPSDGQYNPGPGATRAHPPGRSTMINHLYRLAFVATLLAAPAYGEEPDGYAGIAPLFADPSVLDVTIEAPLTTLMEVRPDEAYLDGKFTYEEDGKQKTLSLKLRTRGNYRRNPEHCGFAPIRLNFRVDEVEGTLFDGQDKLKLVTHCRTGDVRFEQLVAREYIAYRLLHEITSISYAVRMFRITYIDTESGEEFRRLGFVIEDDEAVAARNQLQVVETRFIAPEQLDAARQNLIHVFEFLIGNTEYSLVNPEPEKDCCHNMDILSASGEPPYLPLPFDYDFSGLVNTPYAQPNPRYPIPIVRMRFYKGICANNEQLQETLLLFRQNRDALKRVIDESRFLSGKSRRSVRQYLDSFYEIIANPKSVDQHLIEKCHLREDVYGPADVEP